MFPPETIVELESLSDDYALEVLTVIDLPGIKQESVNFAFPSDRAAHLAQR